MVLPRKAFKAAARGIAQRDAAPQPCAVVTPAPVRNVTKWLRAP
jgi:hypothetical protein